jgi:hypothetical protein
MRLKILLFTDFVSEMVDQSLILTHLYKQGEKIWFSCGADIGEFFYPVRPNNSERSWQQLGGGGVLRELTKTKPNL